ncbi:MAG TPA: NUDIX domain-containing protein [Firmicutes bacterium]|nr:NUDIX domain-containing protein [Bacillota bacterium]
MYTRFRFCPYCTRELVKKEDHGYERLYCAECGKFIYSNPAVGTGVAAIENGKILLVKRAVEPKKGYWALPGGFVEQGETVEAAAIRELFEETRVRAERAEIHKVYTEETKTYGTVITPVVKVFGLSGEPEAGDDVSEARYFDTAGVPELAFRSHEAYFNEFIKAVK